MQLDDIDKRIVFATQAGLPLAPNPFAVVAAQLGLSEDEVLRRTRRMADAGVIRRIGAVPNHYRLGYRANGMTVWDVDDMRVADLGRRIGALDFVSHCYRRPRRLPQWPYNLFAMVHGKDRDEVEAKASIIRELLGDARRADDTLYSTKILKKTGLRFGG